MSKISIIDRLNIKKNHLIKGIHLEGLRKVCNPNKMEKEYYNQGIDEIIFI